MDSEINIDFQKLSYEDLSKEFREIYPNVLRAFQLIPAMYNRLTLFNTISHREALMKIYEDHKDLPGFSRRNIYRYLPSNNPNIPHRIVPSRHKSIRGESSLSGKLTSASLVKDGVEAEQTEIECPRCLNLQKKNEELEEALAANSRFIQADKVQTEKKFRIPLDIDEIKNNINEIERIGIDTHQIWIIAYLDIESENVISATLENSYDTIRNDNVFSSV